MRYNHKSTTSPHPPSLHPTSISLAFLHLYANKRFANLDGRHESVGDDAHAQEHVDERNEVNDSPRHLIPYRRVLGVPHGQDHS